MKINEAVLLIIATDKDLRKIKNGQLFKNVELSVMVETSGENSNLGIDDLELITGFSHHLKRC